LGEEYISFSSSLYTVTTATEISCHVTQILWITESPKYNYAQRTVRHTDATRSDVLMTKNKNKYVTMLLYEIWQKFTCVSRKGVAAIERVPPIRGLIYTGPWDPPSLL
jgi:hypothetical protein